MDHEARLAWAWKHLEAFDSAVQRFLDSNPYRIGTHYDVNTGEQTTTLHGPVDLPLELSLMVGDVLHNLRSALDAFAYALVRAATYGPLEWDTERNVQFPLFQSRGGKGDSFDRYWTRFMGGVPDHARTTIEKLQPYHRTDPNKLHILGTLDELSNVDKHRHLLLITAVTVTPDIRTHGLRGTKMLGGEFFPNRGRTPFVDGYVLARLLLAKETATNPEVEVDPQIAFDVTFPEDGPGQGYSVKGFLEHAHHAIRNAVFTPLESFASRA